MKFTIPLNPSPRYDEIIEPRKKKTKKSEKYVKKDKIKSHRMAQSEPVNQDEIMSLIFSSYEGTNKHVIADMQSELD